MKRRLFLLFAMILGQWHFTPMAFVQVIEPYGLQGLKVTALAYYNDALYAGTDGDGLFVRTSTDSSWTELGLKGVRIRAVYPHDIGPIGWGITVGAEPTFDQGDTTLIYCWSNYQPAWTPCGSKIDPPRPAKILSLDGFPDPRI